MVCKSFLNDINHLELIINMAPPNYVTKPLPGL